MFVVIKYNFGIHKIILLLFETPETQKYEKIKKREMQFVCIVKRKNTAVQQQNYIFNTVLYLLINLVVCHSLSFLIAQS